MKNPFENFKKITKKGVLVASIASSVMPVLGAAQEKVVSGNEGNEKEIIVNNPEDQKVLDLISNFESELSKGKKLIKMDKRVVAIYAESNINTDEKVISSRDKYIRENIEVGMVNNNIGFGVVARSPGDFKSLNKEEELDREGFIDESTKKESGYVQPEIYVSISQSGEETYSARVFDASSGKLIKKINFEISDYNHPDNSLKTVIKKIESAISPRT